MTTAGSSVSVERLEEILGAMGRQRLLVVGDMILDEYIQGDVERISPEAPVPVLQVGTESAALGGAGNVLRNAAALGADCLYCGVVGDDGDGDRIVDLLKDQGLDPQGLVRIEGRPTTRKTRVVARAQQLVRLDRETAEPLPEEAAGRVRDRLDALLPTVSGVILEDYGKGLLEGHLLAWCMGQLAERAHFVAVDPKHELEAFSGASLVKPNLAEAERLVGIRGERRADRERLLGRLQERVGGAEIAVTRGEHGMSLLDREQRFVEVPTLAREIFDNQGAGDTTIAALTLARMAGASLFEAALLANAAAGIVVAKSGTAIAKPSEIRACLPEVVRAVEDAP